MRAANKLTTTQATLGDTGMGALYSKEDAMTALITREDFYGVVNTEN